jgi:hypothetical protein
MRKDPDQTTNINNEFPDQFNQLLKWKNEWQKNVLSEMPSKDTRPLIVGHPALNLTILPSSEANGKGQITRSNKHPNSSYFKQWRTSEDEVIWNIEVEKNGLFEVEFYYACSEFNIGSEVKLEFNGSNITSKIITANETPLIGMQNDKFIREESYTKNFIPMKLGKIELKKGHGQLRLSAPLLKKQDDLEFNLITLRRIN